MRAANTTIKFGAPTVGVMDDTTFREILQALSDECAADKSRADFCGAVETITENMYQRAVGFSQQVSAPTLLTVLVSTVVVSVIPVRFRVRL